MTTTIRTLNKRGETIGFRIVGGGSGRSPLSVRKLFDDPAHPVISSDDRFQAAYVYLQEQLALNSVRTGKNLVDPARTRHILEGSPILRTSKTKFNENGERTTTVRGWSGGHANPSAASYGKTQIPNCWTGDRFMYEVSDILVDNSSKWYLQENDEFDPKKEQEEQPERYVCVEKRYGVPIRVVAERVDDELKCVTAFPDYSDLRFDEGLRVFADDLENGSKRDPGLQK